MMIQLINHDTLLSPTRWYGAVCMQSDRSGINGPKEAELMDDTDCTVCDILTQVISTIFILAALKLQHAVDSGKVFKPASVVRQMLSIKTDLYALKRVKCSSGHLFSVCWPSYTGRLLAANLQT